MPKPKRTKEACPVCIQQLGEALKAREHGRWSEERWPGRYYHKPLGPRCLYGTHHLRKLAKRQDAYWRRLKEEQTTATTRAPQGS